MINRREALRRSTYILGGALSASTVAAVLSGCKPSSTAPDWLPEHLAPDQAMTVAEIAERILPQTDTSGAKAAQVERYIDAYLKDVATEEVQAEFNAGLSELQGLAKMKFKKKFVELSDVDKDAVLSEFAGEEAIKKTDAERAAELANEGEQSMEVSDEGQFFNLMRQLTITGYFTSEIGAKQALVFDEIPGEYQGCILYADVGGAWAL
ncbi:MAG: gluconate 2-dehydrogenase subunit 3 family protein [Saprospiraceae bacterium]|nr:gluconate 2-dehydrogenase subunit 3 family protein [Saprospiraceae bacterium]